MISCNHVLQYLICKACRRICSTFTYTVCDYAFSRAVRVTAGLELFLHQPRRGETGDSPEQRPQGLQHPTDCFTGKRVKRTAGDWSNTLYRSTDPWPQQRGPQWCLPHWEEERFLRKADRNSNVTWAQPSISIMKNPFFIVYSNQSLAHRCFPELDAVIKRLKNYFLEGIS